MRRLPAGIQSFEEIREGGYLYVDKTDLVWQLAHGDKFCYLSRPRRFGKSLLVDTLACYFEGKRKLFEGLKIMQFEEEWKQCPVLRLDMSEGGSDAASVYSFFNRKFRECEQEYQIKTFPEDGLADRFTAVLRTMSDDGKSPVVVLIDEYDSPLQHSWHTPEHEKVTAIYRSVFACLKSCTRYEKFVFLTGITKFTQISLFSVLNNLTNISFMPQYATLCGISKQEVLDNFMPEIELMADRNKWRVEETILRLKEYYDGYHFSADNMVDVYNPYSLVRSLADGRLATYWASSGATSMLPKFVGDLDSRIKEFDNLYVSASKLETSDVTGGADLFLYQCGYLTIKSYVGDMYVLGIPNAEVREALFQVVLPALTLKSEEMVSSTQEKLKMGLLIADMDLAMKSLKALIMDVPYSNKKLESMDMEERYRFIISSIFYAIGLRTQVEHMMAKGRIDIIACNSAYIYVIELKLTKNGGLVAAEQQIKSNRYTEPFKADDRPVIALAIELDDMGKGMLGWKRLAE